MLALAQVAAHPPPAKTAHPPAIVQLDCVVKGGPREGTHRHVTLDRKKRTATVQDFQVLDQTDPNAGVERYVDKAVQTGEITRDTGVSMASPQPLPPARSELFVTKHTWQRTSTVSFGDQTYFFGFKTTILSIPRLYDANGNYVPGPEASYVINRFTGVMASHVAGVATTAACTAAKPQI